MFLSPSSSVYLTIPVRFSISDDILKEPMEGKGSGPSCSGLNLVAHPRAKSKVWKYFGFDTDADGCILQMLPQMYSHTRGTVLSEVASVVYCGVTTDLWESQTQNRTYISLYLHAVNCNSASGFSMINRCLKTFGR